VKQARERWRPAYVGIGSNLEHPADQVREAFSALQSLPDSGFARCSSLYRSGPMGPSDQPDFVNAAAVLLTRLEPHDLMRRLQAIEDAHGRRRDTPHWGPRVVDLDLLVLGSLVMDASDLRIPHPRIPERNFVLFPLADLAPYMFVPGRGSVRKLIAELGTSGPRIERLEQAAST
jgi:2-amino-4-hydroxy-6-hydroxymethyldihydropteridine diphosphokinase